DRISASDFIIVKVINISLSGITDMSCVQSIVNALQRPNSVIVYDEYDEPMISIEKIKKVVEDALHINTSYLLNFTINNFFRKLGF
ncbi:3202_t:CDS:1, partial [Dentiscutata heterogama]